jgi:hypothetical protein
MPQSAFLMMPCPEAAYTGASLYGDRVTKIDNVFWDMITGNTKNSGAPGGVVPYELHILSMDLNGLTKVAEALGSIYYLITVTIP